MTTVKKGEEPVNDEMRDKIFASIRHSNENNVCIDCEKKNPKWASIHLGLHLCIDCAGRHRQYGVIYSFIKSTNLDGWNHKQILFMQKGSNARALEYFRKCGIITNNSRNIDYRSAVVQKYKSILTEQVDLEINGGTFVKKVQNEQKDTKMSMSEQSNSIFGESEKPEVQKEIPNAESFTKQQTQADKPRKKKGKKKMGNQINIDFESMTFDDGVSQQEKDRIVKSYENSTSVTEKQGPKEQNADGQAIINTVVEQKPVVKQLSEQEAAQKLQSIKTQTNVKSISSDQFKDQSQNNIAIKQKFNQFEGAKSISSSSFNNDQENTEEETAVDKLKEIGGKLYEKFSGYWAK